MSNNKTNTSNLFNNIKLDDVIGQDGAINELKNIVLLQEYNEVAEYWHTELPKGILFVGPPGVGKTMAARALANDISENAILMELKYSDIGSKWYDGTIENIKAFFDTVEKESEEKHVIVFIDEIDSFLGNRDAKRVHEASIKLVNEILAWLDGGFFVLKNVTLIGATNNIERMDKAAIRPGRFDKILEFKNLTSKNIIKAFESYLNKYSLNEKQIGKINFNDIEALVENKEMSGADIPNIIKNIIKNKASDHALMLKSKQNKNIDDLETHPQPITTEDLIKEIEQYFHNKKSKPIRNVKISDLIQDQLQESISNSTENQSL